MTHVRSGFVIIIAAIASIAGALPALAQGEDNPLQFKTDFARIGGEIGLSSVWQSGIYTADCGVFDKGARINPTIALAYDTPLTSFIRFEALVGYEGLSVSSSYNSHELQTVSIQKVGSSEMQIARAPVDFENQGTASFSSLFAMPSIKIYPTKWLYAGGGLFAGLLMGGKSQYTKNILSKSVDIPDYGLAEVYYPDTESSDPYSKVYPAQDIPNKSGLMFGAVTYVGAEFSINRRIKAGPRLLYQLPFNAAVSDPQLKLNAFMFLIGLRMDLH
ncbi:MAG: hypothetical protein JST22_06020 [Bacteroidetes bacterium]|nr:hypothetical protein [Bacteroidota bacterium]